MEQSMLPVVKKSIGAFALMANEVQQICSPLHEVGIHLFSYRKTFADGSRINVSSNAHWLHDYYELNLYQSSLFEQGLDNYHSGFVLWPQTSPLPIFTHSRDYYNSDNGITFIKKHADYCEFFIFGADKNNKQIINFYINHLDLLRNFADYFLEQSHALIKSKEANLIQIPLKSEEFENNYSQVMKPLTSNIFVSAKHSPLSLLSEREISCLKGILAGKTAKIIARELNLSYRTIEYYIANLKKKTNSHTLYELLTTFKDCA
jgi:DNA-binding CsgD family transcriptional regulator